MPHAQQHRALDLYAGHLLQQFVRDVSRGKVGENQCVHALVVQGRERERFSKQLVVLGEVGLDLAIDNVVRMAFLQDSRSLCHLLCIHPAG